jgi:FkbM family methyltransferase
MPGFFADLLALPARLAQIEQRLEAIATLVAARSAPPSLSRSVYLGENTALAMLEGRLPIYVDTRSTDIAPHLLLTGSWEPEELRAFRRLLRPGDLALDLGAHVGVYALSAAEVVGPAGRVHAFEPNPRSAGLLRRSLAVNGFAGFAEVHLLAAGAAAGASTMMIRPEMEGGGFLDRATPSVVPRADGFQTLTVQVVALDTLFPDPATRLGVAKLDIEGMEGQALLGMRRLLERSPEARLMLEWAPAMLAGQGMPGPELVAFLQGLGFRFWRIGPDAALEPLPGTELAGLSEGIRNIVAARGEPPWDRDRA